MVAARDRLFGLVDDGREARSAWPPSAADGRKLLGEEHVKGVTEGEPVVGGGKVIVADTMRQRRGAVGRGRWTVWATRDREANAARKSSPGRRPVARAHERVA